jgi:hypothetical protein
MSNTPARAPVTAWLLALIRGTLPAGQTCGDMRAENNSSGELKYPYRVLWPIPGGYVDGPALGQAQGDALFVFQLDSVGKTRDQAEQAADRSREAIAGRGPDGSFALKPADPNGLRIHDRIVDGTPGAPLLEGQSPNEVYTVSETYGIYVSVI